MLRGGALKPTDTGQWAHVVCALAIPDVVFADRQRSTIATSYITPARRKLVSVLCVHFSSPLVLVLFITDTGRFMSQKCVHCLDITRDSEHMGVCTQCCTGKCATAFHVTCGHAAGIQFRISDWPFPIYLTCTKHLAPKTSVSGCY